MKKYEKLTPSFKVHYVISNHVINGRKFHILHFYFLYNTSFSFNVNYKCQIVLWPRLGRHLDYIIVKCEKSRPRSSHLKVFHLQLYEGFTWFYYKTPIKFIWKKIIYFLLKYFNENFFFLNFLSKCIKLISCACSILIYFVVNSAQLLKKYRSIGNSCNTLSQVFYHSEIWSILCVFDLLLNWKLGHDRIRFQFKSITNAPYNIIIARDLRMNIK